MGLMDKPSERRLRTEILVLRVRQGDVRAFEELVDLWQRPLWSHAYRLTQDVQASWDITQEAWITIARKIVQLEDESQFLAWSFRIVTHKTGDWIRRQKRQRVTAHRAVENRQLRVPEQADGASTTAPTFEELISRLSPEERAILSLRYERDFRIVQIGTILGLKEGTVKSRLYNARMKVKRLLEDKTHDR
jgi:RNA polymerase sigma factor (sigma-70 family)